MTRIAQCLIGDRRPIAGYESAAHVPYPMLAPLTPAELEPFVTDGTLVTFTVKVPLSEVARAADGTLAEYIENTWLSGYVMTSPEYRAVGASFDEFDEQYNGQVHLQVTCKLDGPYEGVCR